MCKNNSDNVNDLNAYLPTKKDIMHKNIVVSIFKNINSSL